MQWLQREGLDISKILVFDTMLAELVILGNRRLPLNLDAVARRYGYAGKHSYISNCIHDGICPSTLPRDMLKAYCREDVNLTHKVFLDQRRYLRDNNLLSSVFTRCIYVPVLADIEGNGMHLDKERVLSVRNNALKEINDIQIELSELSGGINLRSTAQKAHFLYGELGFDELRNRRGPIRNKPSKQFPEGTPKTDTNTILQLKAKTKDQKRFKELYVKWNSLTSSLSKNLDFFYGIVNETKDHVFQAVFNQTTTKTHRLSSSGKKRKFESFPKEKSVQFQNLPRGFKPLFNARHPGWKIGERDAKQIEFRVAAFLGNDKVAYEEVRTDADVHNITASVIGCSRQDAKSHTFKPLYYGQSGTEDEQRYYKFFQDKYKGIYSTQNQWIDSVLIHKKLVTVTGLVYYFPDTKVTSSGYITNSTNICNYPVQGLATAEIMPVVTTYMWHMMRVYKLQSFIVNVIHDSIITEETEEEYENLNEIASEAIEKYAIKYLDKVYGINFDVPLQMDSKASHHWNDNN